MPPSPPEHTTTLRNIPADSRGRTDLGWLHSQHSFSFGGYHDPQRMGYHGLRVLNDDRVAPGRGFDTHPHREMEILTWVLDGQLAHRDSMGHDSSLGAGGIQLMSAGTGVRHSEYNGRDNAPVHFLQIWISPSQTGTPPRYQEAVPDPADRDGRFVALATPDGRDGSLTLGADARVMVGDFGAGQHDRLLLDRPEVAYLHVAAGNVTVNGHPLAAGDAMTVEQADAVEVRGVASDQAKGQVLAFVLPG